MKDNIYEVMLRQQNEQQEFEIEKNLEEHYLFVLALTDKSICLSEIGKENSRSITAQIRIWKESLSAKERNTKFLFIKVEDSFNEFKDYVLNKYSGSKKDAWEAKFSNPQFVKDAKRLFISRVYRHKYQLAINGKGGFFSGLAHNQMQLIETKKHIRGLSHEAANKAIKYIEKQPAGARYLTRGDFEAIREIFEDLLDQKIENCLPDRANEMNLKAIN
ncbi:hypothetical protein [Fuchsiella alkaliacetigena]|uniref:hypothetical protein n=1 Tax=Fuchsiella alkaliacetigena TaxID=957042 RepID=UPI00200A1D52|nr:hypothetical protein [Fuchsiella alkaliacetigena]MCK8824699.1 hypothetical protein [Fuchsiella alkaliacetigena]